jgi:phosphoribosylformylglycinamidine synthase
MMPHPEAFNHPTNHPRWTRQAVRDDDLGIRLFRNAVEFIKNHL